MSPATKAADRRIGTLEVWYHRKGPRGGDYAEAIAASSPMGARALALAYRREPDLYHAVRVMRWNGVRWEEGTP